MDDSVLGIRSEGTREESGGLMKKNHRHILGG